jgi:hypothetical protein
MADFLFAIGVAMCTSGFLLKRKNKKEQRELAFQKAKRDIVSGARDWISKTEHFTDEQDAELVRLLEVHDPIWRAKALEVKQRQQEGEPEGQDEEEQDEEESEPEERPVKMKGRRRRNAIVQEDEDEEDED